MLGAKKGIGFIDCGVSGGVWGLENGYALMAGGTEDDIAKVQPVFDALKPEGDSGWSCTPDRVRRRALLQDGPQRHRVRHDAGLRRGLRAAPGRRHRRERHRGLRTRGAQGTVIRSWLLDLLVRRLHEDPDLAEIRGYAEDSGEGRWTVEAAIDNAVPMPAIAASLFARFASRQDDSRRR